MEDGNGIYIDVYFEDVRKLYYELPNTNAFLISEYYYRPILCHNQINMIYKTSFITTNFIWKLLDKLTSSELLSLPSKGLYLVKYDSSIKT